MATLDVKREARRKNFYLPLELAKRADAVAERLGVDFSHLTREAIRQFVEKAEKDALEKELADACKKSREFNRQYASGWWQFETKID